MRVVDPDRALRAASAGAALAWGRALGEFGATLMFAGSFDGVTQTVPLAIYDRFAHATSTGALALSAVLVVRLAFVLLAVKLVARRRRRSGMLDAEVAHRAGRASARRAPARRWRGSALALAGPSGAGKSQRCCA